MSGLFRNQSSLNPSGVALLAPSRKSSTYAQLIHHCCEMLGSLNAIGVRPGDRVALIAPNGPEMAAAFFAIHMGASCAPLNPNYRAHELEFYLSDIRPMALIVAAGLDTPAVEVAAALGIRVVKLSPIPNAEAGMFTLDFGEMVSSVDPIFAAAGDEAMALHTSGTTARPKMVALTNANLASSAASIAASLALTRDDRCLNVMPLFHIHGLVGALLATVASGGSIACTPGFEAPRFLDWCAELAPTWYTAVPTMHQALLARAADDRARVPKLRFIRSCSAPLSSHLMAAMEATFGVPVVEAYGMTEASHQITINPMPPMTRKPGSVGVPTGAEVSVIDESGNHLGPEQVGEIVIRGPGVTAGYAKNSEANEKSFIGGTSCADRWFRTGDLGHVDSDGYVFITGRVKETINRGGQKISPREIDEVLTQHPAVAQAVAFAMPDARLGEEVAAAVVLRAGHRATELELRDHAAALVADYKVPRRILFLDELPKGPTGKVQRIGLAEKLGLAAGESLPQQSAPAEYVAPRTPTETLLARIWEEVLGVEQIGVNDDFLYAGGDSVLAALAIARTRSMRGGHISMLQFFEHPTIAALSALIDSGDGTDGYRDRIVAASAAGFESEARPLSYAQRRMWFLDQLDDHSAAYNRCNLYRIRGPLDQSALAHALQAIVERHAILRTTYNLRDGEPVQVISPTATLGDLEVLDLSREPEPSRMQRAIAVAVAETNRKYDLSRDLMMRALLVKLAHDDHLLVLASHHIASDGWSTGVLMRDLSALYSAYASGAAPEAVLPPLPIQYADFAAWQLAAWQLAAWQSAAQQSASTQGSAALESIEWWKARLSGAPPLLALPTDRPRPARETFKGASEAFTVPRSVAEPLVSVARSERATFFMALLAAFQAMLHRYTGQDDIVVGTPVAGRDRVETEGLVGLFLNTLAMRADLAGDPTYRELIRRTRDAALATYAHADLPFEMVVEAMHPARNLSYAPIFQVTFQLRNYPLEDTALGRLAIEEVDFDHETSPFDLSFEVTERDGKLFCKFIYNTDLFDRATIARMAGHFTNILEGAANDPDRSVSRLPMLTSEERHQLLVEWNPPAPSYRSDQCVHQLFEEQVELRRDAVALVLGEQRLTYRELNERANRLANHLAGLGVGSETMVGVCLERSLEMVIAMLAILKAGGAYVPLDPEYPRDRLEFILTETGAPVLLTQQGLLEKLPDHAETVCIDRDSESIARSAADNPRLTVRSENLAYVIYTSGSTGMPKGVQVEHRNITRLLKATEQWVRFSSDDVWTLFHSYAFDFSVWELWGALAYGGRLVVVPLLTSRSPELFDELLREQRVTVLNQTPSAFMQFMHYEQLAASDDLPDLRLIIFGGEALDVQSLTPWFERHGDAGPQLVNIYGITETTVHVTYLPLSRSDASRRQYSPIGRPIADLQVYILDQRMNPLPTGVIGEMYVGGPGVARGYLNRPELNAERFIADPFRPEPGARLYKSGDLARFLTDGNIEYVGRSDSQVKIRGFRIELGEIDSTLTQHGAVRAAAVLAREDESGDRRLVAYAAADVAAGELRNYLKSKLPPHMIPAAFVMLDALPLTANGKIDRAKLPSPDAIAAIDPREYVAPRDDLERRLRSIWEDVLNVRPIGVHHNFFELGGHSLMAARLLARIQQEFHHRLALASLFQSPTVEGVAKALRGLEFAAEDAIVPLDVEGGLPLSFGQQGMWFVSQLDQNSTAYNLCHGFRFRGPLDRSKLGIALSKVVARHAILRTTYPSRNGEPFQVIAPPAPVDIEESDLRDVPEEQRFQCALADAVEFANRRFDLSCDSILRVRLVRLGADDHLLILATHHIAWDGWSAGVMFREMSALYGAQANGSDPRSIATALPPPAIQYADFARWQVRALSSGAADAAIKWWKTRLHGAPPLLALPTDRPRPPQETFRGAIERLVILRELTDSLGMLARRENATLYMVLLAAFQVLLHRYTGAEDLVVGSPVAGRAREETERLIGLFVNMVAMRGDLSGDPTFREFVRRTRDGAAGAYWDHHLPFELLVEAMRPERSLSYSPIFQVTFQLQNFPHEEIEIGGLEIEEVEIDRGAAHFDLSLEATERAGEVSCKFIYNTDLFDRGTIARMAGHFTNILEGAVKDPDRNISRMPMLSAEERHQLLVEWNDTRRDFPRQCVHRMFEAQAERTPDAVAVAAGGEQLTYRELNRRANRLALALSEAGVGARSFVGICIERSLGMYVGLLGILKAGAAYVPLDPAYPHERLEYMLDDSGVSVLVTSGSHADRFTRPGLTIVEPRIEADSHSDASAKYSNVESADVGLDDPAYVIYTSGSTGTPKGVIGLHRGLMNRLQWMWDAHPYRAGERACQKTALSFVDSVSEIFGPLLMGVPTVVIGDDDVRDPRALVEVLARERITRIVLVPSLLSAMLDLDMDLARPLAALRLWVSSGEVLGADLAARFRSRLARAELLNLYGSTEVSADATAAKIALDSNERTVPIGRPIANMTAYLLDRHLELVPVGVAGEICVGGAGVARGYHNAPELTARKFVADPFSAEPGARLFRSGDLGRRLPDGTIEYLGRADDQVKIRGFRIELGEIEAVLSQHRAVRAAAVVVKEEHSGDKRLVAYAAADDGAGVDELRNYLKSKLPAYMIPAAFVMLDAMPLTPSGKIDRARLPALDLRPAMAACMAPRTDTESRLLRIWQETLQLEQVGIRDNFFDLGGHSLMAAKLLARIEREFNRKLRLAALFISPTIETLAPVLDGVVAETGETHDHGLVPIQPLGARPPLFVVGNYALSRSLARHLGTDQPLVGLLVPEVVAMPPSFSLEALAAMHVRTILDHNLPDPLFLAGYSAEGVLAFEVAQQLARCGRRVALLAMLDTPCPVQPPQSLAARVRRRIDSHLRPIRANGVFGFHIYAFALAGRIMRRLRHAAWRISGTVAPDMKRALDTRLDNYFPEMLLMTKKYRPRPYLGRVVLFKRAGKLEGKFRLPDYGWGRYCGGDFKVIEFTGEHESVLIEPYAAEHLSLLLREAVGPHAVAQPAAESSPDPQRGMTDDTSLPMAAAGE